MRWHLLSIFLVLSMVQPVYAVLSIDINRGNVDTLPIALPYANSDVAEGEEIGKKVVQVIQDDLERSGLFRSINRRAFLSDENDVNAVPEFSNWRQVSASALMTSSIKSIGDSGFSTEFRLWDVLAQKQIAGQSFSTHHENWRRVSHLISDDIYHRLTGEEGYFDSRIVYVSESGPGLKRVKRLAIMDQDGHNHRYLTDGENLVLTPRFSPTLQEVIYLSYQEGIPKVFIRDVDTGEERLVGNFPGMTFAPRFSPDGKQLIMTVSEDGNSDIYTMDLKSGKTKRLTTHQAIDTSPSFSPDGKQVVFNSDRGGSQQLYVMDADGGDVERISFSGNGRYGTPVWSPRGDLIAFTKMHKGRFYIGVMRPDGTGERLLTESWLDEGPSWSPNGRVIVFARQQRSSSRSGARWNIYSIDITGYNERLIETPKDASDPAWSPLIGS